MIKNFYQFVNEAKESNTFDKRKPKIIDAFKKTDFSNTKSFIDEFNKLHAYNEKTGFPDKPEMHSSFFMTKDPYNYMDKFEPVKYLSYSCEPKSKNYFKKILKEEYTKVEVLSYSGNCSIWFNNKFKVAIILHNGEHVPWRVELLPSIDELMKILNNFEENYPKKVK